MSCSASSKLYLPSHPPSLLVPKASLVRCTGLDLLHFQSQDSIHPPMLSKGDWEGPHFHPLPSLPYTPVPESFLCIHPIPLSPSWLCFSAVLPRLPCSPSPVLISSLFHLLHPLHSSNRPAGLSPEPPESACQVGHPSDFHPLPEVFQSLPQWPRCPPTQPCFIACLVSLSHNHTPHAFRFLKFLPVTPRTHTHTFFFCPN